MFGKKESSKLVFNYRGTDNIFGTDFLYTRIVSENASSNFKGSSSYTTHNLLFLSSKDLTTNLLFPTHTQILNNFYQIPLNPKIKIGEDYYHEFLQPFNNKESYQSEKITGWLLYVFAKNSDDLQTIALSDSSGNNLVELITNVKAIHKTIRINSDELVLLYNSNNQDFISKIKLSEKRIIQTQELPTI